ncbi:MAG: HAD family hydrolase [Elainellaceae cyanobacterium]
MTMLDQTSEKLSEKTPGEVTDFISRDTSQHTIVVDFDETLLLRNSTEEFLNTIAPRTIAAIVLMFIEAIKPWKWFPKAMRGNENRDWFRVVILTLLFPWNLLFWQRHAKRLAQKYANPALIQAIKSRPNSRVVIVTKGFNFIVDPIVKYLPLAVEKSIGCRFWQGYADRTTPKEKLMQGHFTEQEIQHSIFVTDSLDDRSYLSIADYPFFVQWEDATYIPAMTDAYLPLFYAEKVKRPGKQTIKKLILKNHFIALFLALSWISPMPIVHGIGILFLTIAFWCIYEVGYWENDRVAEQYEKNPTLSETYHRYKTKMNEWEPWIWATLLSIVGLVLLQLSQSLGWSLQRWLTLDIAASLDDTLLVKQLALWLGVLAFTRLLYVAYNYLDETTRVWVYPLLQYCKYFSFLLVAATSVVGMILLFVQTLVEWVPYIIYRCGGQRNDLQTQVFRVYLFVFFCLAIAVSLRDFSTIATTQFAVILVWSLIRCKQEVQELRQNAHLIVSDRQS